MSMNIFRVLGDQIHVVGICILLYRLIRRSDAHGISLRSLELYLLVFCTRYLDLLTTFYSHYNSFFKLFFIGTTALCVYWIRRHLSGEHCRSSTHRPYHPAMDTVSHWKYVAAPCGLVALMTHYLIGESYWYEPFWFLLEFLYIFSIYLEAFAMLPQLVLVWRYRRVERWAGFYIFSMGLYRMFYILDWIYRANYQPHYRHHWVLYVCAVVQSVLYADFFYYACTKRDRPLLAWRRTVANSTAVNAKATDPLLVSAEEQMRVV